VIRIERIWLTTEPLDMRAGTETALARLVQESARVVTLPVRACPRQRSERPYDWCSSCSRRRSACSQGRRRALARMRS
jgi:hypothetical protein